MATGKPTSTDDGSFSGEDNRPLPLADFLNIVDGHRQTADDTVLRPVLTVVGYGCKVRVESGHLLIVDGIRPNERVRAIPRADRTVRRLLILGEGFLTTAALSWCRAVGIAVIVTDEHGVTLAAGPTGYDDARLRRAQAGAYGSPVGIRLAGLLIAGKLRGHARVARQHLHAPDVANQLESAADEARQADTLEVVRTAEALAAQRYWEAWPTDGVLRFVTQDARRVPAHWVRFDGRRNPVSGRNSRAIQPVNAVLNYLYRLAEIESRLAAVAVGLDPGLGFIHTDHPGRDALALDLMEPVRAEVEAYALRLFAERRFRRADFIERPDGTVRLLPPLNHQLTDTLPSWGQAVGPWAERIVHVLQETIIGRTVKRTPLTSSRRREAVRRVREAKVPKVMAALPPPACQGCGVVLARSDYKWCPDCLPTVKAEGRARGLATSAAKRAAGTAIPQSETSRAKIGAAQTRRNAERAAWDREHPESPDPAVWGRILIGLRDVPVTRIRTATGFSKGYVYSVKRGDFVPHPRWWSVLAELAKVQ